MKDVSILIADDHTLVRETWSFILSNNPGFSVVGECGNAEEAIALAARLRPDIVIMDINMPGMNGIEATAQIRKLAPGTKVLGISLHTQPAYAKMMMQRGAMGYVTKNSSREEMFCAIREVNAGRRYICREIKEILSEQVLGGEEKKSGLNNLTQREMEIIGHIRSGASSKEIARALHVSVKTVEVHRYNILRKLNLKNAAALVNFVNTNHELAL